ncbi:DUF445 domain-containing protein [Mycolicibacterium fluoranthenivorans]|jgi:uncharacterized membrane protein YheB (UPF0754 family)|uniref:Uncharacterized membrane protein YheB, UPF0754 family n=1 Tax=Mycolicibacterium fluoranthenivorans TaxID=258505 RepID=A0A1G4X1T7_9MYCO|nr:hypothetical protein [Mycolicibacterium fluoranthenivorans]SCX33983.1 Uncharacterized membrane protein YheB, UPF0754 family [Mycolicibacterium fluoranthenivorans]
MSDWFEHAFTYPWWVYVTIPLGAAFVGWVTKILALKMMFYPVEFVGIKPYFGWQGQIPKRAPKMAAVAVDSLTSGILKPEELFDKIDPDELVAELGEPLRDAARTLVDTMMMSFQPQVWRAMPDQVKDIIVKNVEGRIPSAARGMFGEFRGQVDQIFDIKHMVITNLVRDKATLNNVFQDIGKPAFKFLIKSGLYFGFIIGLVQMLVFGVTGWHLALPLFGLLTGGLTDYVALQMIFRPLERKTVFPGIKWQGVFQAEREQVIHGYAALMAREIFTPKAIMESLLTGPMSDKFFDIIQTEIGRTIDSQMGFAGRVISAVGGRQYQDMKLQIAGSIIEKLPETSSYIEQYAAERLDLENVMVEKMMVLDSQSYENLLRPAFKDDEWIIVVLGAALGFICGEIQSQLILLLAH